MSILKIGNQNSKDNIPKNKIYFTESQMLEILEMRNNDFSYEKIAPIF